MMKKALALFGSLLVVLQMALLTAVLIEQGYLDTETQEALEAAFSLLLMIFLYITIDLLRDSINQITTDGSSINYGLSIAGAVVFLTIGIVEILAGSEFGTGLALWSFLFAIAITAAVWGNRFESYVERLLDQSVDGLP